MNGYQTALLIAGYDPSEFEDDRYDIWPAEVKKEVSPYMNAIKNAARSEKFGFREEQYETFNASETDWYRSLINIDILCEWMRSRNFVDGYFLMHHDEADRLLNKAGEFYAPELAAAVRACNEVTSSPEALNGKTPKKALEIWLRKHANEYGLTNKDGNPNELGIEEICKVANWKPTGGASPTPIPVHKPAVGLTPAPRKVRPKPPTHEPDLIIDDNIAF